MSSKAVGPIFIDMTLMLFSLNSHPSPLALFR